jgi:alkylation response protein AidB-like acyl-CoA dehydrogenase
MTPEVRAALAGGDGDLGDGQAYRSVIRQLGRDGWLALSWPAEFGGHGGTMLDQLIFTDEAAAARVPVPFLTINTVGPTIMRFGTPEQKSFYLPKIAAGEIHFSIGYSEPEAGTDLASLHTTAVRDGEEYVIDGQKMWTSLIQYADYVWLACRTDPAAERHRGLSIIIVPTDAPGFSWTPVPTVAGVVTSATYYSGVRVPASSLVGEENQGWPLITSQLNHERVALTSGATGHLGAGRGAGMGGVGQAGQRPAGHRRGMGPAQPGPGARQGGVPEAAELAGGLVGRRPGPGRRVGHEGVRHRVRGGGVPAADGGARRFWVRARGVARRGAGRADGVVLGGDRLLGPGEPVADWLAARGTVGLCAMQAGVLGRALELTAGHARTRVQFGRPIGAFQAVAQRLADGFIDVEAVRLTMWQAAWLLSAGLPADVEVATAKFWAADAGHRVAHTAVHVHGGLGIDVSYPVHRYFAAAKGNEFALGGATAQLRRIGAALARLRRR